MFRILTNIPSCLLRTSRTTCRSSRQISKSHTNYFKFRNVEYEFDEITPMSWCLLLVPITTFGLGCWQVKRKEWKEGLIQKLQLQTNCAPVNLPDNLDDLDSMEYCPVRVRGKFLHDKELVMGPRSFVKKDQPRGGGIMTQQDGSSGYLIITPLKLEGREETILINRGWVPRKSHKPETRPQGQINETVDIVGLVRKGEARPQFTPKSRGDMFMYRDLNKMCNLTGAVPVFIDANLDSSVPGGPIGGQTVVSLRNEHMSYIATWFGLSAVSSCYWIKKIIRQV